MESQSEKPQNPNPNSEVCALVDLGGTLTSPNNFFLLERFVQDVEMGIGDRRRILLDRFAEWRKLRNIIENSEPERQLPDPGMLYAKMVTGMKQGELREKAERWVNETGSKSIMPYSRELVDLIKQNDFRPVLVSSAPPDLVEPFAKLLAIPEFHSLQLEKDHDGKYTGEVEGGAPMSLAKNGICRNLSGRNVKFAIGNSSKDSRMFSLAIDKKNPLDPQGGAVLINPSPKTEDEAKAWMSQYLESGQLLIIPQNTSQNEVIRQIRHVLEDIVEVLTR